MKQKKIFFNNLKKFWLKKFSLKAKIKTIIKTILFTSKFKGKKKFNKSDINPIKIKPNRPFSLNSLISFFLKIAYLSKKPLKEKNKHAIEIWIKTNKWAENICIFKII